MAEKHRSKTRQSDPPSPAQEDYLETIYKLSQDDGLVRVTDIADRLSVRLPPVTRAVQSLERMGFVARVARRGIELTDAGRRIARALAHRHADIVYLLTEVFGVPQAVAQTDTCQMEHGISSLTAQRLHEFLEHFKSLDAATRGRLRADAASAAFRFLPDGKSSGWRA